MVMLVLLQSEPLYSPVRTSLGMGRAQSPLPAWISPAAAPPPRGGQRARSAGLRRRVEAACVFVCVFGVFGVFGVCVCARAGEFWQYSQE